LDTLTIISKLVKFHRKSGLSKRELVDTDGVGKTVIFDIEKGKTTIKFETLLN
jgi:hypothetical protein